MGSRGVGEPGVAAPDGPEADLGELVDARARLLRSRGRGDSSVVALTEDLAEALAEGQAVRCLAPGSSSEDRALAVSLARREPVHPPATDAERERRLAPDRMVFVVEHPRLAGRPMNALWVALCTGVPDTLTEVLDPGTAPVDPSAADTAVMYSIWNAEEGLAGIGAGRRLVAGAAAALLAQPTGISTVTTMSPIPGFRAWQECRDPASDRLAACARYLTSFREDGRLIDPVARFHMGNGARLWRLLPRADPSPRGEERSWGIMANYRYHPEDSTANAAALSDRRPAVGPGVASLLGGA